MVYSRASDDNVHAALNLPPRTPTAPSRRPTRQTTAFLFPLFLFFFLIFPPFFPLFFLPLHYIIFHPFRRARSFGLRRRAPPPSPPPFSSSSFSLPRSFHHHLRHFVFHFLLFRILPRSRAHFFPFFSLPGPLQAPFPCSYFMRAGVSSPSGRTLPRITRNARDQAVRRRGERMFMH